jgi:hypothetical protein
VPELDHFIREFLWIETKELFVPEKGQSDVPVGSVHGIENLHLLLIPRVPVLGIV